MNTCDVCGVEFILVRGVEYCPECQSFAYDGVPPGIIEMAQNIFDKSRRDGNLTTDEIAIIIKEILELRAEKRIALIKQIPNETIALCGINGVKGFLLELIGKDEDGES